MLYDRDALCFLKEQIRKNGTIALPAEGISMFPLIKAKEICRFAAIGNKEVNKGDIMLFHSHPGQLIAHRFYEQIQGEGDRTLYVFKGDANRWYDEPVPYENILGKLISIHKGNVQLPAEGPGAKCWGKAVMYIPFLSGAARRYAGLAGRFPARRIR